MPLYQYFAIFKIARVTNLLIIIIYLFIIIFSTYLYIYNTFQNNFYEHVRDYHTCLGRSIDCQNKIDVVRCLYIWNGMYPVRIRMRLARLCTSHYLNHPRLNCFQVYVGFQRLELNIEYFRIIFRMIPAIIFN